MPIKTNIVIRVNQTRDTKLQRGRAVSVCLYYRPAALSALPYLTGRCCIRADITELPLLSLN